MNVNVINSAEVINNPGIRSCGKIISVFDGSQQPFGSHNPLNVVYIAWAGRKPTGVVRWEICTS